MTTAPDGTPIVERYRALYSFAKDHKAWIRSADDLVNENGGRKSFWGLAAVLEELSRAELRLRDCEQQLTAVAKALESGKFEMVNGCHAVLNIQIGTIRADEIRIAAKKARAALGSKP